jgi:uncharacterized membrane protein
MFERISRWLVVPLALLVLLFLGLQLVRILSHVFAQPQADAISIPISAAG